MFISRRPFLLLSTVLLLAGCVASPPAQTEPPGDGSTVTMSPTGASLDPILAGLIEAKDRTQYAQRHDLRYREGAVQVVVELDSNTSLPTGYDVRIEHRTTGDDRTYVQAFVDVDDLLPLASESPVRLIRPTLAPATHGG